MIYPVRKPTSSVKRTSGIQIKLIVRHFSKRNNRHSCDYFSSRCYANWLIKHPATGHPDCKKQDMISLECWARGCSFCFKF